MELGATLDMVILKRIFAPSKGPKWAQQFEKSTTNNYTKKKMNKNEKNSKLRGFFWLVPLPKGRYRCQAPYADVSESQGLRGPKNGQIHFFTCKHSCFVIFCLREDVWCLVLIEEEHWIKRFIYEFDLWPLKISFCLKVIFVFFFKS